ncbi:MAG TPA: KH domain-containing protein, partial [Polyangiaceae bacterium]|nr:KH domain-containing protein [Polyangiaceae bacterium]
RPVLFFVREYVREAVMNQLRSEVPHAVAVTIEQANETETLLRISATIHVEKVGQRKIVVGKAGAQIKAIGIAARQRIEALVEKQVHLELFVRITDEWKNAPRKLAELGYDPVTSIQDTEVKGE